MYTVDCIFSKLHCNMPGLARTTDSKIILERQNRLHGVFLTNRDSRVRRLAFFRALAALFSSRYSTIFIYICIKRLLRTNTMCSCAFSCARALTHLCGEHACGVSVRCCVCDLMLCLLSQWAVVHQLQHKLIRYVVLFVILANFCELIFCCVGLR
jgi:hypothetical protein